MTLNAKIGDFLDFLAILGCNRSYIIYKVAPQKYRFVIQIENLVFVYQLSVNTPIFS